MFGNKQDTATGDMMSMLPDSLCHAFGNKCGVLRESLAPSVPLWTVMWRALLYTVTNRASDRITLCL